MNGRLRMELENHWRQRSQIHSLRNKITRRFRLSTLSANQRSELVLNPRSHESDRLPPVDELKRLMQAAIEEARAGLAEGGIPIGSALALDGAIVARGHNRRVQKLSTVLHAEMDCLEATGRRISTSDFQRSMLFTTLSPCDMCSGAILLYKIPVVVIGENGTFRGPEEYLQSRGVKLIVLDDAECRELMQSFIAAKPELWNEDIGV